MFCFVNNLSFESNMCDFNKRKSIYSFVSLIIPKYIIQFNYNGMIHFIDRL